MGTITFTSLLATSFLMELRISLAFWAASACQGFHQPGTLYSCMCCCHSNPDPDDPLITPAGETPIKSDEPNNIAARAIRQSLIF